MSAAELVHGRVQRAEQIASTMKPAPRDERERVSRLAQCRGIGTGQQGGEVHAVLWARAIIAREHLQGDEMAEPSDRHFEARHGLDRVRRGYDLGLDSGRGEEQIDDRPADVLTRGREPDGRQASRDVLFDGRDDAPAAPLEVADERLGVAIVGNEHREIGIARESGLGASRHRQAADQREPTAEIPEVRDDTTERGFGAAQGRDGGQAMERPQPSPCSAPGRVSSQATSRASISASVASGCSRRSWARRIDSPSAQRSKAVRNRAANASGESSATELLYATAFTPLAGLSGRAWGQRRFSLHRKA